MGLDRKIKYRTEVSFALETVDFPLKEGYICSSVGGISWNKAGLVNIRELGGLVGQEEINPSTDTVYCNPHLNSVLTFTREVGGQLRKVQVMVPGTTPLAVILTFHSSKLPNLYSYTISLTPSMFYSKLL